MKPAGCDSSSRRACAVLAILLCTLLPGCARISGPVPEPITSARILLEGSDRPPDDGAAWISQHLPDDWSRSRPGHGGDAWYRLEFQLAPHERGLVAIYIPRLSMVGRPYVNGTAVAVGGRFAEPLSRMWYRPQFHLVPPELLTEGVNTLDYRLRTYPDSRGGLSRVYVGDPVVLEALWRNHVTRQVTALQVTTGITTALGLLAIMAWLALGREHAYAWLGFAALCWGAHGALLLAVDVPIPHLAWELLTVSTLIWVLVALMMFELRFAGLRRPWLERCALAYAALSPPALWIAGTHRHFGVANLMMLMLIAIGAYQLKLLADVARRSRTIQSLLLVAAALLLMALGAHDWLVRYGGVDFAAPYHLHYGVLALFIVMFWNLLGRAAAARRAGEALATERERIMREMHDGIGSQLMTARELAGRGELPAGALATLIDECIDDLRLSIDSLEPDRGGLLSVLGNLRYRLAERLARQQVSMRWDVADLPADFELAPGATLQVLRIVQEAVTNALKHSGAEEIAVSVKPSPEGRSLQIEVRDDGRGFAPGALGSGGRGLRNMHERAAALGGTLQVASDDAGTLVKLTLPASPVQGIGHGADSS